MFCYLGSILDFLLDDTIDVDIRIGKANKVLGALNFIWDAKEVKLHDKIKLFLAILVNFALWNGEIWSGNKADLHALDTFMHKAIRRILHIRMLHVKDEKITNDDIRKKFGNIKRLSHIWRTRLLKFVGRSIRQHLQSLSRLCITSCTIGQCERGRPFRTNKDAITESIRLLIPSMSITGPLKYWAGYAKCEQT